MISKIKSLLAHKVNSEVKLKSASYNSFAVAVVLIIHSAAATGQTYSFARLSKLHNDSVGSIPVEDYKAIFPNNGKDGVLATGPKGKLANLEARALALRLFVNFSSAHEETPSLETYQKQTYQIGSWRLAAQLELALIELVGWTRSTDDDQLKCRLLASARTYAEQARAIAPQKSRLIDRDYLNHISLNETAGSKMADIFFGAYAYYESKLSAASAVCSAFVSDSRSSIRASIENEVNDLVIRRINAETETTIAGINDQLKPFKKLEATLEGDSTKSWNAELSDLERDVLAMRSNLLFVAQDTLAVEALVERITKPEFLSDVDGVLDPSKKHPLVAELLESHKELKTDLIDALVELSTAGKKGGWEIDSCAEFASGIADFRAKDVEPLGAGSINEFDRQMQACTAALAENVSQLRGADALEVYGAAFASELDKLSGEVSKIMNGESKLP